MFTLFFLLMPQFFPTAMLIFSRASEQLSRLRRNMRLVRQRELTPRQQEMLHLYYDLGLTIPQIAKEKGLNKSTVSRTLARGRERLKRYLLYSW